jgi:hypothetical protein
MAKLTDTQLIVLSKAAQRDDGGAIFPVRMNRAAAAKVGSSLVGRKLMREVRAKPGMPEWRKDEDGRSISLVIMRAGRDAIGVEDVSGEGPAAVVADPKTSKAQESQHQPNRSLPRTGSKQALVVTMLSKKNGVTIDELIAATGWLPHTTRAALTALRKRGFEIDRSRGEDTITRYYVEKPSQEFHGGESAGANLVARARAAG